jgi:hypothetical protein
MQSTDVATVVLAVLHAENRRTDDLTKVMGTDLLYTTVTILIFLGKVQTGLQALGHTFNPPPPTGADALTYSIAQLIGVVDGATTTP